MQLSLEEIEGCVNGTGVKCGVAELKVEDIDFAAENELFYNMFREAAKLMSKVLCKGRVVKYATIYGILVAVQKHRRAILLKLKINYFEGVCTFERCRSYIPFEHLINEVVSIL